MGQQKINNTIFLKILEVPEYMDLFCVKIGRIYQALTTEVMLAKLEEMVAIIEPEMEMHFSRWAEDANVKFINSDSSLTVEGSLRYWNTRLTRLRSVIRKRPYYLYTLFQEHFKLTDAQMIEYFGGPCPEKPAD